MPRLLLLATVSCAIGVSTAVAQSALPIVEEVDSTLLQKQIRRLQEVIQDSLSTADRAVLRDLAEAKDDIGERVQKLLDPYCLIGVTINPESRVKAARGPRTAELIRGREALILIKVQNDAGVTQGLRVSGEQLRGAADGSDKNRWLEAAIQVKKPLEAKLSGQKLEYVVMRLKGHESGKREATLKFDVGQGTQDLGFRAEVPILFSVKSD
jgi:hypothetical protein